MAFGSPPQRDHTPLTPLVPSPQPSGLCSVINSRGPGPSARQAGKGPLPALHGALILGKSSSGKLETSPGKMVDPREDLEGEAGRASGSLASGQPGTGPGLGPASGFTRRFLVFPRLRSLPHTFPVAHPSVHHPHCLFILFLLYIDPD